MSKPKSVGHL